MLFSLLRSMSQRPNYLFQGGDVRSIAPMKRLFSTLFKNPKPSRYAQWKGTSAFPIAWGRHSFSSSSPWPHTPLFCMLLSLSPRCSLPARPGMQKWCSSQWFSFYTILYYNTLRVLVFGSSKCIRKLRAVAVAGPSFYLCPHAFLPPAVLLLRLPY